MVLSHHLLRRKEHGTKPQSRRQHTESHQPHRSREASGLPNKLDTNTRNRFQYRGLAQKTEELREERFRSTSHHKAVDGTVHVFCPSRSVPQEVRHDVTTLAKRTSETFFKDVARDSHQRRQSKTSSATSSKHSSETVVKDVMRDVQQGHSSHPFVSQLPLENYI